MAFGEQLKKARRNSGLTQQQVADLVGITKSTYCGYETGKRKPDVPKIKALSKALNVSGDLLIETGWEDEPTFDPFSILGIERPTWQRVPLLGDIACGEPILAEENIEEYVSVAANIKCDFVLRCKGDSMEPRLSDGDIVFIRQQQDVDDGQIAAVLIDSSATLKHVYHLPDHGGVQLIGDNPSFAPKLYTGETAADVRILGRAVAYQRAIR